MDIFLLFFVVLILSFIFHSCSFSKMISCLWLNFCVLLSISQKKNPISHIHSVVSIINKGTWIQHLEIDTKSPQSVFPALKNSDDVGAFKEIVMFLCLFHAQRLGNYTQMEKRKKQKRKEIRTSKHFSLDILHFSSCCFDGNSKFLLLVLPLKKAKIKSENLIECM